MVSERRAAAAWTSGSGTMAYRVKGAAGTERPSWGINGAGVG